MVLLVYKQLQMQLGKGGNLFPFKDDEVIHIVSYDEKPGMQAIANVADGQPPTEDNGTIKRLQIQTSWYSIVTRRD